MPLDSAITDALLLLTLLGLCAIFLLHEREKKRKAGMTEAERQQEYEDSQW